MGILNRLSESQERDIEGINKKWAKEMGFELGKLVIKTNFE